MNELIKGTLPILLRAVRHPVSCLTALLAMVASETSAAGVAMVAVDRGGNLRVLAAAGTEAARFESTDPANWYTDRLKSSGTIIDDRFESAPWSTTDVVCWRSTQSSDGLLTLVAYGVGLEQSAFEEAASVAFMIGELAIVSSQSHALRDQLLVERHDRALSAASLRHDLRTPLSSILGFAQVLREADDIPPEEALELLELIVVEAEHMANLVTEGLNRESGGEDAPLKLQPINPAEVAESVATAARESGQGGVMLDVSADSIITDPTRLTRGLLNLVDNAIKYSVDGEPVRVSGSMDGDHYKFVVADAGPGVPEDMVPTLFLPYTTDPNRVDGTGLGLFSVATIAKELGGRVAYARRGDWTTFSLWISCQLDVEARAESMVGAAQ